MIQFLQKMFLFLQSLFSKQNQEKNRLKTELSERKPLPTGKAEFEEWSDRIISGANLIADKASQKFALASMITTLGPTDFAKPDVYFIQCLLAGASKQVAGAMMEEIRTSRVARKLQQEADKKPQESSETASQKNTITSPQT